MKLRPRKTKGKSKSFAADDSDVSYNADSPPSSDCSFNDSCCDEVPNNIPSSDESLSESSQDQSETAIASRLRKSKVSTDLSLSMNGSRKRQKTEKPGIVKKAPKRSKRRKRKRVPKTPLKWEEWENEDKDWIDENLNADFESLVNVNAETENPSSNLVLPLLRYQKEWLAWGIKQENSPIKGGILADEMGMGKTLQAIALVLSQRESASLSPSSSYHSDYIKTTLVVCPVVAVSQWVSEIGRFTSKGSTTVLVYHGANRPKDFTLFSNYDFVITTYSTVESEYRKFMMPPKERCEYCGKAFNSDKLRVHQKYFCGPDAVRTDKQSKQQRKKGKTEKEKKKVTKELKKADKQLDFKISSWAKSVLHSPKWNRIILDEAHYIKDRRCNTAKATFALESRYKWALSGTPLQNRVGELYSLIRFLQIVPYSFYLCKNCDCFTLDHRAASACSSCPHNSVRHFCWWNKYVANPIQASANSEKGMRAMLLLKHKVLKRIVLRRTKCGRAADLALPSRIVCFLTILPKSTYGFEAQVTLRRDSLDIKEEDYYDSLYNETQSQFNAYVTSGTVMNNYAHIFDLLTRLRQAVDHPYLVVYSTAAAQRVGESCGICHEAIEERVVSSCGHAFCRGCLLDYSASLNEVTCPTCSKPLTVDFNLDGGEMRGRSSIKGFKSSSILNRVNLNDFRTSTKVEALREELGLMYERDSSAKALVFSQFTQFLDIIRYSLQKSGMTCVQLEGNMTLASRDAAIRKFNEDAECRVFLMSLKAGGVALNLTVASHVFLMDPWWNPAVERQAQDRIHRIGQYKPIRVVRFLTENTIEERILRLQEKKELVFEGTVGGSSDALGKLTEGDLRFLFSS